MTAPPADQNDAPSFVGRAGHKLRHALDAFGLSPGGLVCADLGCNVGGFTDCLLQAGARRVYAVDTGYGALAWKLRTDPRVTVMERTNALHADPPEPAALIAIDLGWTPQRLCIPAALRWLDNAPGARIVTLIKPHYEASAGPEKRRLERGVLPPEHALSVLRRAVDELPPLGVRVLALTRSPLEGGASRRVARGNTEYLALLARA